jgi:hypothetical protein
MNISMVELALLASVSLGLAQSGLVFNFVATPRGPDGTQRAHVGDTITSVIRFQNTDDFNDSLFLTNLVNVVQHNNGSVTTPNLLSAPVLLSNFGEFVRATNTFNVLPGDGPDLSSQGEFGARHNADGLGTTHLTYDFAFSSAASIRVFVPAVRVTQTCGVVCAQNLPSLSYSGAVSNAGQFSTTLTNVIVMSDNGTPANTNDDTVFVIGTLTNGQTATYSNVLALPSQTITNTVRVRGTDELGLTVWNTNQCVVPLGAPISLDSAAIVRPSYLQLKWSSVIGTPYQVQVKPQVDACVWTNLPFVIIATATNTIIDVPLSQSAQFFRVVDAH